MCLLYFDQLKRVVVAVVEMTMIHRETFYMVL